MFKIDKISSSIVLLIFLIITATTAYNQQFAISGYIIDAVSHETLIGATIFEEQSNSGVVTDQNGFFQLAGLISGKHELSISHMGYMPVILEVKIEDKSLILSEIKLEPAVVEVGEVSIVAARPDVIADREVETSHIELTSKSIQSIPTAGNDVFSAIKYLPGIDRTEPFSPLFTVRGSDPGENAVMLDGVMIYNPYHSSVTSGIFNTQTIKSVDLLMGGFGAEYGGRNSSVMYINTKDGNSSEIHGEIEPSTFHSKAFLEFPVGKKGSAMVAGRYYYDMFSEFILQNSSYFYDLNFSYTIRVNPRNRLTFKYFYSHDKSGMNFNTFYKYFGNTLNWDIYDDFQLRLQNNWSNQAATIIHKWVMNPRVFLRTQVYYSAHNSDNYSSTDFRFNVSEEEIDTIRFNLQTGSVFKNHISDLTAKSALTLTLMKNNTFRMGVEFNRFDFQNTAKINAIDQGELIRSPFQISAFAEDKIIAGPIIFRPGIRLTQYDNEGWNYEPRANAVIILPANFRLKLAWGIYYQHVISMNTNEVEMNQSVDYYFPLTRYNPSKSVHYIAGLETRVNPKTSLSLDIYYKDIERVYTFDINQSDTKVLSLSDKLQKGSGEAYGVELMLRGAFKNLSGWVSYGLSWANRTYPFLNDGKEYPYDYNRRHTVKLVANYAITRSLEYNVSFVYLSGIRRSIEQVMQNYYYYDPQKEELSFFPVWISEGKNLAKMPALINLDMSIRKRLRTGFGSQIAEVFNATESYLTITIRNVTFFRRNIEYYIPIGGVDRWEGKYLPFGTNYIPSVGFSYTIKF